LSVDADQYDIVLSFFREYTDSQAVAQAFAENLFKIANITGIDVLTLLDSFRGKDSLSVSATMAYYLNSINNKTLMYGVSVVPKPNENVQRNIVQ
jgi:hypothetical protein